LTAAVGEAARWQRRVDSSPPGKLWSQLRALGFVESSIQFSAVFVLFFVPFLLLVSAAVGSDLSRAFARRSGFSPQATRDITTLFVHSHPAFTVTTVIGAVLAVLGADSMSKILQTWYGKVYDRNVGGPGALARRVQWLVGVAGFLLVQITIGRRVEPAAGSFLSGVLQFAVAGVFWWWTLHCLLNGQVGWKRLLRGGAATALCYTAVGLYIGLFGSSSIVGNESQYGPIGAVMAVLTVLVGLGVAVHLGAVLGAVDGSLRLPGTVKGDGAAAVAPR
jgi:membrane protein